MTLHIQAPTRLHFGLLSSTMPFGGLGVALDQPRVIVSMRLGTHTEISGSLANRAEKFLKNFGVNRPVIVRADGPEEHTGLGIGTALGLSLARAWLALTQAGGDYVALSHRGQRSRIGIAAFAHGGFLFDHGHGLPTERLNWPPHWCFALLRADCERWHSDRECLAFAAARPDISRRQKMVDLIEKQLKPAISCVDFHGFCRALAEYNRLAGEPFQALQGGQYASPAIQKLITELNSNGYHGAGQSSWGPTVYVPCEGELFPESFGPATLTHVAETGAIVHSRSDRVPSPMSVAGDLHAVRYEAE